MEVKRLDEFALIRHLNPNTLNRNQKDSEVNSSHTQVIHGIGDDAAVVQLTPGMQLVTACDAMVETVHFLPETMDDFHVGYKALVSNISDMAAMGAVPKFVLITLMAPKDIHLSRLENLYKGIYQCADEYGVAVIGGDTVSTPAQMSISITILGEVEAGQALLRSTAEVGDVVFVTGPVGSSAAGLHFLLEKGAHPDPPNFLPQPMVQQHQMPKAQVAAGRLLLKSGLCHALNDISDGLASEAWEIAEASGKRIQLQEGHIPTDDIMIQYAKQVNRSIWDWALFGGEDYQLLGTVAQGDWPQLKSQFGEEGLSIYAIGEVIAGNTGVEWMKSDGTIKPIEKKGFNHFRG
jgi:thiamine-monophosphate kinase